MLFKMNILSFYVYNICKIMLKARLTTDNQWIIVESDNAVEMKQLRLSYTKKIPNWHIIKKEASYANVDETFMNSYGMIPKGLWLELVKICKKYNYSLQFTEDFNCRIKNCNITREDFDAFIDNLFSNSSLIKKDYQIDGVFNILQYQNCCAEVSTSGGKTLMTYLLFKYMIDKLEFKHILYVTPKTDLTTQSSDKFADYDKACNIQSNWTYNEIHGAAKKKEEYNETIVFGNYQSLCKKKKSFFDKYDVVIIDECHHTVAKSIRSILNKCDNAKYKIGLTGTFPKEDTYENFLKTASKTSAVIGSTVADFTNATADFARLGYTIEQATELAKAASVYKNVGDGIDSIDQATESIISTMKAFGIEADNSMAIVDKFNEVGK